MAETWLTWSEFLVKYPNQINVIPESQFPQLAQQAAFTILDQTYWRASIAEATEQLLRLSDCQALLVCEFSQEQTLDQATAGGAITSANNDGYSESYTAPAVLRAERQTRVSQIIRQTLGAPDTKWMLYAGGVYHPVGRK